jgi:hypothetical protein
MSDNSSPKPRSISDALNSVDPVADDPMLAPVGRERRMNVRAYNYWAALLDGRDFPSVVDLEPDRIETFRENSILLDFSRDPARPAMRYVGKALRDECGLRPGETRPDVIPGRSMLSRLTDHYLEIIANRAPIGFEAEFANLRGHQTLYRGILLPLSDDGETINFIYGVINWKEVLSDDATAELLLDLDSALAPEPAQPAQVSESVLDLTERVDMDEAPDDELLDLSESAILTPGSGEGSPLDLVDALEHGDEGSLAGTLSTYVAGDLAEDLDAACAAAEKVKAVDSRSRVALYDALDAAYRFFHAARQAPAAYDQLLTDRNLKLQTRAPFTPVVKLVFGQDYDKTRLTEYAAAMNHAEREGVPAGQLRSYIERFEGGLKGLVKAERAIRAKAQGNSKGSRLEAARQQMAERTAVARVPLSIKTTSEFVVLIARPSEGGLLEIVDLIDGDDKLIDAALRRSLRRPTTRS